MSEPGIDLTGWLGSQAGTGDFKETSPLNAKTIRAFAEAVKIFFCFRVIRKDRNLIIFVCRRLVESVVAAHHAVAEAVGRD